ncbi:MAG: Gfo/Idh/MocA family oxidoreductase [Pirellulales bacterium]|nr:Gfo/Idh/MocA family oxidoreductase [Pirellulales bacterium]
MKNNALATSSSSRRTFLKQTGGAIAGASLAGAMASRVHAAGDDTIKIALVGCGGRGTGAAANALATQGPTKLVAMADVFDFRLTGSRDRLAKPYGRQVDVPKDRQFLGMDAYRKAIDAVGPGGVVVLATPPAFRPLHVEYAVEKGCHVFMEKSFAVDAPGLRRVMAAGKQAESKNLKIGTGLMSRHCRPLIEAVQRIHDGAIGEIISAWAYRLTFPAELTPRREGTSELAHQIRNFNCFPWLSGSFFLDWLVHSLDVACWAKNAWPVSAQGQGGREVRNVPDQMFDHYAVEYTFADGTRMMGECRQMANCFNLRSVPVHGTRGSAVLGEKFQKPAIYRGYQPSRDQLVWRFRGKASNCYQVEHDELFDAIRNDKPYNETERSAKACMTGLLGRMAAFSGQQITWDEAMASKVELAPGLDQMTMDSPPPVVPDANGQYPIATPGVTKVL